MYKRLHSSIPDSLKLGKVSDFAFRCWTVGLSQADWFGRLTAEPEKFVVQCFPNRREVTPEQVKGALDELANVMGEGLIHLYRTQNGKEYLVFHRNQDHNPQSTHPRAASEFPPPPKGLCECVKYTVHEGQGPFGGREFRFYPGLFDHGGGEGGGNGSKGTLPVDVEASSAHKTVQMHSSAPTSCTRVHEKDASSFSPLREEGMGGCGGGQAGAMEALGKRFHDLTGRKPWRSEKERIQLQEVISDALETQGVEALSSVLENRITRDRAQGKSLPVSLSYFGPVFADCKSFHKVSTKFPQSEAGPKNEVDELAAHLKSLGVMGSPSQISEAARSWLVAYKLPSLRHTLSKLRLAGVDVFDVLKLVQTSRRLGDPACGLCKGSGEDRSLYVPGAGGYAYCICAKPVSIKDEDG